MSSFDQKPVSTLLLHSEYRVN